MQYLKSCFLYFLLGNLSDTNILSKSTSQLWKIETLAFRIQYHQISENFTHLIFIPLTSVVVYTSNSRKRNSFQRIDCFQINPQFFFQTIPKTSSISPFFSPYTTSESTTGTTPLTLQHQCYLWDAILSHCSPDASESPFLGSRWHIQG